MMKKKTSKKTIVSDWVPFSDVIDHLHDKEEGRQTILIPRWFDHRVLKDRTIIGSFTWTQADRRWALDGSLEQIDESLQVSQSQIARAYLDLKFVNWKPRTDRIAYQSAVKRWVSPPNYAKVGASGHCVYLDLKSAYWNILRSVGWDVDYSPNLYLSRRSHVEDFGRFAHYKIARNSLVSAGIASSLTVWTGQALKIVNAGNRYQNRILWTCVQDILHAVACDMVDKCGARYVATDGYLIPIEFFDRAVAILNDWHLPYGIKGDGETFIYGVRAYKVGTLETKNSHLIKGRDISNLSRFVSSDWLMKRYAFWASRVGS
jgi:hypothetical protein